MFSSWGHIPFTESHNVALRQTQRSIRTDEPNWHPWVVFFLSSLASLFKRLEENIADEEKPLAQMPALSVQLIDIARKQGRVTVAQAVELTGVNRNTVRAHLKRLVDAGHLKQHGSSGRGVWYGLA